MPEINFPPPGTTVLPPTEKRKRGRPKKIREPLPEIPSQNRISLAPEEPALPETPVVESPQEPSSGAGEFVASEITKEIIARNPGLEAAPLPLIEDCIRQAFSFGLDPSGVGGFARIVFKRGKVALVLGYTGIAKLAMESGELVHLDARPVYDKDTFALDYAQQILQHAPYAGDEGSGAITGAWAVTGDRRGFKQMQFVSGRQIKEAADASWIDGMTAEEVCRKVAVVALLATSPLALPMLRHALDYERRMTEI